MSLDLTTIVVNWNTVDLIDGCLTSIRNATPSWISNEIIVVDNGSRDGSADHVRDRWPDVRLIANDANVGFCRANNAAIRASSAPIVLLVNTDARLHAGGIAALLDRFADDPCAAVVGPRLVYGDGSFQRWTAGRIPSLSTLATFFLGLDRLHPWRRRGLFLGEDTRQAFRPEWVSSAVMALRRSALEEIGLLDEQIFVYMDDVDLCARAGAAGWHVWYAAETTATHFMGASSHRATGKVSPEALRALNRWYVRRHGPTSARALRAVELLGFGGRVLLHSLPSSREPQETRSRRATHAQNFRLALEPIHA